MFLVGQIEEAVDCAVEADIVQREAVLQYVSMRVCRQQYYVSWCLRGDCVS